VSCGDNTNSDILGVLKMFKIAFKIFWLYISMRLLHMSYMYFIGEAKPYYCISACDSFFERSSQAFIPFIVGSFIFWKSIQGFFQSKKLIKKGKYCFKKNNFQEPYCCKCYEENEVLSKLKKIDNRYLCMYCDYTELYIKNNGIEDISVKHVMDNVKKL